MRHIAALLLVLTGLLSGALWLNGQPAQGTGDEYAPFGSYTVEMNVISGAGHQPFIMMPHTIKLKFTEPDDNAELSGPNPFVTVYDNDRDEDFFTKDDLGDWEFKMSNTGTVAGHENVLVTFNGHFESDGRLTGVYAMGADGDLPGGYAIEYQVKNSTYSTFTPTATEIEPTDTPTRTPLDCPAGAAGGPCAGTPTATPGHQETVAEFLELFNTALQTGDETFLLDRLNPHVIEAYGEKNCATTVAAMIDPTSSFTIKSISGPAPWTWSVPVTSVLIDDVYTVSVQRVVEGESSMQDIHLAAVEDHLTWFRTCPPAETTATPDNCLIAGGSNCTPTATPTPQAVPPTPTRTPTDTPAPIPPTPRPTARPGDGDCDHNGNTNALDALHVLQYTAGLIPNPGACGDTNQDGVTNTIDVSLILQYVADFISSLPWH